MAVEGAEGDLGLAAVPPALAPGVEYHPVRLRVRAPAHDHNGVAGVGVRRCVLGHVDAVLVVAHEGLVGVDGNNRRPEEEDVELHGVRERDQVPEQQRGERVGQGVLAAEAEDLRGGGDVRYPLHEGGAGEAEAGAVLAGRGHAVEQAIRRRDVVLLVHQTQAHAQRGRRRERGARAAVALLEHGAHDAAGLRGVLAGRVVGLGHAVERGGAEHGERADEHLRVGSRGV